MKHLKKNDNRKCKKIFIELSKQRPGYAYNLILDDKNFLYRIFVYINIIHVFCPQLGL